MDFKLILDGIKEFLKIYRKWIFSFLGIFFFWLFFFHWTGVHQAAICRNFITGEMWIDTIPGYNITAPWVQVSRIDTRPQRVCVDCDCRNLNCQLVSFDPDGWEEFVRYEGFRYYWWSNRFSFNPGHKNEYRGMNDILRGYAFDGKEYPFIKREKSLE